MCGCGQDGTFPRGNARRRYLPGVRVAQAAVVVGLMIGAAVWTAGPILLAYGITIGSCKETNPPKYNAEALDGFSNLHYGTRDLGSTGNGIWVASDGPGIASSGVCFRVSSVINYDANTGPIENQVEAGWYWSGYGAPDPAGACVVETAKPYAFMNYLYNDGTGDSCVDGTGLAANEGTHVFFKVWDQSSSGNTDQTWDAYVSTSEIPNGPWQGLTAGSSYEMTNGEIHGANSYGYAEFNHNQYWKRDSQSWGNWTTDVLCVNSPHDPYYAVCYSDPVHTGAAATGSGEPAC